MPRADCADDRAADNGVAGNDGAGNRRLPAADGAALSPTITRQAPPPSQPAASGACRRRRHHRSPRQPPRRSRLPAYKPGFLHQLKIWWDDSLAVFDQKSAQNRRSGQQTKPNDPAPGVKPPRKPPRRRQRIADQDAPKTRPRTRRKSAKGASTQGCHEECGGGDQRRRRRRDDAMKRRGRGDQGCRRRHRAAAEYARDAGARGLRARAEWRVRLRGRGGERLPRQRLQRRRAARCAHRARNAIPSRRSRARRRACNAREVGRHPRGLPVISAAASCSSNMFISHQPVNRRRSRP